MVGLVLVMSETSKLAFHVLLQLPESKIYEHWLVHVAKDRDHGLYLSRVSERSKRLAFLYYLRWLRRVDVAPVGVEVPF